jgi:FixJ family two-component response regulator
MHGSELKERLRASQPELPVLFISGYDKERLGSMKKEFGTAFLAKPFTPGRLLESINALLGENEQSRGVSAT